MHLLKKILIFPKWNYIILKNATLDVSLVIFSNIGTYGFSPIPTLSDRFILRSFPGGVGGFVTGSWLLFERFCVEVPTSTDEIRITIAMPIAIPTTITFFKIFCKSEKRYKKPAAFNYSN